MNYNNEEYEFYLDDYFFYKNKFIHVINSIINKQFSFKYDLKNNTLFKNNTELNIIYNNYVDQILKSNLTKEYIESIEDLQDYEFIYDNEEILKEFHDNTIFVYFPCNNVSAITDKNLFFIFVNKDYSGQLSLQKSIEVCGKSISQSHEYINHCTRVILAANDFSKEKKTPETQYKNIIYNSKTKDYKDGGDKWEKLIFGNKIDKIYLNGLIFLFDINNFNNSIEGFSKLFKNNNKKIDFDVLNGFWNNFIESNNLILKLKDEFNDELKLDKKEYWTLMDQGMVASEKEYDPQCIPFNTCSLWMDYWP